MRPPSKPPPISLYHRPRIASPTLQCRRLLHQQSRLPSNILASPTQALYRHPSKRYQTLSLSTYTQIRHASSSSNPAQPAATKQSPKPAKPPKPSNNSSGTSSAKSPKHAQDSKSGARSGAKTAFDKVAKNVPEPVQKAAGKVGDKVASMAANIETSEPLANPASAIREIPPHEFNQKLNLPAETYAPHLDLVIPPLLQIGYKFAFSAGKKVFVFFKEGAKRVWHNSRKAKEYRNRVKEAKKSDPNATPPEVLTRAEWQLMLRSRLDLLRLIPFVPVVWILGEWLIVLWPIMSQIFPEPCRLPNMIKGMLVKSEKWRTERERRLMIDAPRLVRRDIRRGFLSEAGGKKSVLRLQELGNMGHFEMLRWSVRLNAHGYVPWDYMSIVPPRSVLRWGLRRKLKYLSQDDALIARDGGWAGLNEIELRRACTERGLQVTDRSEEEMRRDLGNWMEVAIFPRKILQRG